MASPERDQQGIDFIRRLAAGTAHDVNNLLLLMTGCAELALDDETLSADTRKLMTDIMAAGARAGALTRQFMNLDRPPVTPPLGVDVAALLRSSDLLLRRLVGEHVKLDLDPGPSPLWVQSDPSQVEQIVVNLAMNARDAMPTGGTLTITADTVAGQRPRARLTVTDTGSGIDPAIRRRMYEPYVTTKSGANHCGLGLAVVRSIVDQLGGSIQVATAMRRGTTFTIELPQQSQSHPSSA